jgi:hypothetical protein
MNKEKEKIGDWGLGIGDWGLGIGPNPQSPIPNPEEVVKMENPVSLYHPREFNGSMYVCSHAGEILKFSDAGDYQVYVIWGGQPQCKNST